MARSGEERCGENNNRPVRPSVPVPPPSVCVIFAETGKLSSEGRGEPRGACSPPESPRCPSLTGADGFVRLGISPGRRGKERLQQRWWQAGGGFLSAALAPPNPEVAAGVPGHRAQPWMGGSVEEPPRGGEHAWECAGGKPGVAGGGCGPWGDGGASPRWG